MKYHSVQTFKSMAYCKTLVTPLLMHWSYYNLAQSHRNINMAFFGYYFGRRAPCFITASGNHIPVCYQLQALIIAQSSYAHRIRICCNGSSKSQTSTVNDQSMGSSCPPLITAAFEFPADGNSDGWVRVEYDMANMIQWIPWTPSLT